MRYANLIFLLLFINVAVQAQRSFSLEEALQYAAQNSNTIRLSQLETATAEGQIQELRAVAIPKVSTSLGYQHFPQLPQSLLPGEFFGAPEGTFIPVTFGLKNSISANFDVNAVLFDPQVFVGIKSAELYRDLVVKQINQTSFEVRYNVTKAYLGALIPTKNKEVLDNNIANLEKTLAETNAFYKEGFVEKLDVERLELSLENLKRQSENANQFVVMSTNLLKFQMGFPLNEEIVLTDNIDVLINTALLNDAELDEAVWNVEQRPEYQVIKSGESLNKMNIKAKEAERYPSARAFANHNRTLQRNDVFDDTQPDWIRSTVIGATINVPIFNGMTTKRRIQQAEVDLRKTELQLVDFEHSALFEYENAKIAYDNAKRNIQSTQRSLDLATRIYETSQTKYKEGVGSSLEVTQAEGELYQAQGNHINALYDLLVARTDLYKALGKI